MGQFDLFVALEKMEKEFGGKVSVKLSKEEEMYEIAISVESEENVSTYKKIFHQTAIAYDVNNAMDKNDHLYRIFCDMVLTLYMDINS